MSLIELVNEILLNAALKEEQKPYKNVYFIKVLNPGDRKNLFVSFRYMTSKKECLLCRVDIDLNRTDKNVFVGISHLKVRERESITFFKKSLAIPHKNIVELIKAHIAPLLAEKIQKVEDMYESN
ncbi:hypothetical protein PQD71_gp149 [Kosakonia phage Kc263]|uniref:Uncharacterized protein n=1 Tax=Kosakonia phage Kc263 TaxID=2863194 RepID=A0AAE7WFC8_9CAUD|nr:hypothetical protein PQD71_gp149 [Kosakonia phage Kc263]QYN80042.1 hypothetical protein [Kosakonia phage Kc263]